MKLKGEMYMMNWNVLREIESGGGKIKDGFDVKGNETMCNGLRC